MSGNIDFIKHLNDFKKTTDSMSTERDKRKGIFGFGKKTITISEFQNSNKNSSRFRTKEVAKLLKKDYEIVKKMKNPEDQEQAKAILNKIAEKLKSSELESTIRLGRPGPPSKTQTERLALYEKILKNTSIPLSDNRHAAT